MGCYMSALTLEHSSVISSHPINAANNYYWEENTQISFSCPEGQQLYLNETLLVPDNIYQIQCPDGLVDTSTELEFDPPDLSCRATSSPTLSPTSSPSPSMTPSTSSSPSIAPTSSPSFGPTMYASNSPSMAPTAAPISSPPVTLAPTTTPSTTADTNGHDSSIIGCQVKAMEGIWAFHSATNQYQVELVPFPVSDMGDGNEYYHVLPHETITLVCVQQQDGSEDGDHHQQQRLRINGQFFPSVNFYSYTCLADQGQQVALPISCEEIGPSRRSLLRGAEVQI